jgi:competence protein ComEC
VEEKIAWLLAEAHDLGVAVSYHQAGDTFSFDGSTIRVLAPNPELAKHSELNKHFLIPNEEPGIDARRNDEPLVMKLTYGKTSALLEADAERATEKFISHEDPSAEELKVAHHGSASSTNDYLLAAVHPHFAAISVGARNVYHHPRAEVLGRLQRTGLTTYRTDLDGATSFFLDGKTVTPQLPGLH